MRVLFCSILISLISFSVDAQADTAVMITFGGSSFEEGFQIVELEEGGYMVIGTTGSNISTDTDFYLMRLDENFQCLWNGTYGSDGIDWGKSIVRDEEGNFVMCGFTNGFGVAGYDVLIYKIDQFGEIIWQRTVGGVDWDFAEKVIVYPDNGYLISGYSFSGGSGSSDCYLIWINNEGELMDEWFIGNLGNDKFADIAFDESKLYLLENFDIDDRDFTKIEVWDLQLSYLDEYVTADSLHFNSMKFDSSEIYLGGYRRNFSYNSLAFFALHKVDFGLFYSNLDDFGGLYEIVDLIADSDIVLACRTDIFGLGGLEQSWQQRDIYGAWQSTITFGSGFDDTVNGILRCSDNSIVTVGSLGSENGKDLLLVHWLHPPVVIDYSLINETEGCFSVGTESMDNFESPDYVDGLGFLHIQDDENFLFAKVFDLSGRLITTVLNESIIQAPSGVYVVQNTYHDHVSNLKAQIFNH